MSCPVLEGLGQGCICVSEGIYTTMKELLQEVVCMFVQSVGLQCACNFLSTNLAQSVQLEGPQFTVEGANCYSAAGVNPELCSCDSFAVHAS